MNSPTATPEQVKCPFCDKEGLPILPTRYAIANPARAKSIKPPALDPQFGAGVTDVAALPADTAQYTLRLLRGGYLYVFNEKRGTWSAYVVTDGGYLYEFDFNDPAPALPEEIEFSCTRAGDAVIARCITVKDAHVAGKVWLGFSDVLWTDEVKRRHRTESWRRKHMRCIDIAAWRGAGGKQAHVAPLTDVGRLVADFTLTGSITDRVREQAEAEAARQAGKPTLAPVTVRVYPAYSFSPYPLDGCKEQTEELVAWAERAAKPYRPLLTALWDPVGIASELDPLMDDHYSDFLFSDKDLARKMALSSAIMSVRESIGNAAELEVMRKAQEEADRVAVTGSAMPAMGAGMGADDATLAAGKLLTEWIGGEKTRERYRSLEESYRTVPQPQLLKAREASWDKYQTRIGGGKRYDEEARAAFQRTFDAQRASFEERIVLPLAKAHRSWMVSQSMANVFESNYDDADPRSGQVYVGAISVCIGNTQDKKVCFDLYTEWLQGDPTDRRNLILRALGFNQQEALEAAKKAAESGIDPWAMSWPSLIKSYEFADKRLGQPQAGVVAHLITLLSGPVALALSKMVDGPVRGLAVLLGMMSGKALVPVQVQGEYKAFRRELIRKLRAASAQAGQNVPSRRALHDPVELELRRLEVHGVQMEGSTQRSFFVLVDPERIAAMPQGLTKAQRTAWLSRSMKQPSQARLMDLPGAWRTVFNTEVRIGTVALMLDAVLLIKLWKDKDDMMQHKSWDTWCRIGGGVVGVLGGSIELASKLATGRVALGAQFGRGLSPVFARGAEFVGKRLTAVGGFAMAVFDFIEANREFQQGNIVVSGLYVLSGIAGLVMVWAVWVGATGWGIVAAIVLLVIAGLLAWLVDDKIQDWIERCYWGSLVGERYADADVEMEQLALATKD